MLMKFFKTIFKFFFQPSNQEELRIQRIYQINESEILSKKENLQYCASGNHRMYRISPTIIQCWDCGFYKKCNRGLCNKCDLDCSMSINRRLPAE